MIWFGILFLIILLYIKFNMKIKIKWKTFLKRGFKVERGVFGTYCYVGMQGEGKSYSCAEYVYDNYNHCNIFSNISFKGIDYIHYNGFKEMLTLRDKLDMAQYNKKDYIIWNGNKYLIDWEKQILFIYDELFSELSRGSKIDNNVLDFISQMRKRKYILLTTCQVWNDIPITWRRLTRYQIDCKLYHFFGFNLLVKTFKDSEKMKWDNLEQEFIAPLISTTITHTRLCVSRIYDTFELIHNKYSKLSDLSPSIPDLNKENENKIDSEIWGNEKPEDLYDEVPEWKK